MTHIHSYPSIHVFGHKLLQNLFNSNILIEEKIDGSQLSFMHDGTNYNARSKGKDIDIDNPDNMFKLGIDNILTLDLHVNWIYRGEYLRVAKHNVLKYDRVPAKNIILFDIERDNQDFLSYKEMKEEAERIGLEVVPLLSSGDLSDMTREEIYDFLISLHNNKSILGDVLIEGVVIKNYNVFGADDKVTMGKLVSDRFKETHKVEWKIGKDIIRVIIDSLKTDARYEKAIQHLRDSGELSESVKDIGPLIKEIQNDILNENREEIMERLFKHSWDGIRRGVVAGFPEWYKKRLMVGDGDESNGTAE